MLCAFGEQEPQSICSEDELDLFQDLLMALGPGLPSSPVDQGSDHSELNRVGEMGHEGGAMSPFI